MLVHKKEKSFLFVNEVSELEINIFYLSYCLRRMKKQHETGVKIKALRTFRFNIQRWSWRTLREPFLPRFDIEPV